MSVRQSDKQGCRVAPCRIATENRFRSAIGKEPLTGLLDIFLGTGIQQCSPRILPACPVQILLLGVGALKHPLAIMSDA
tara:strand:- start:58634 stop:58870 length:237 start_codon:yes stop_codon:yes gene_type:complete